MINQITKLNQKEINNVSGAVIIPSLFTLASRVVNATTKKLEAPVDFLKPTATEEGFMGKHPLAW